MYKGSYEAIRRDNSLYLLEKVIGISKSDLRVNTYYLLYWGSICFTRIADYLVPLFFTSVSFFTNLKRYQRKLFSMKIMAFH